MTSSASIIQLLSKWSGGLTIEEASEVLKTPPATIKRDREYGPRLGGTVRS
jgi:hypothetical protein